MSQVPLSERTESYSSLYHKLFCIRRKITDIAINDFAFDQEKYEKKIQKYERSVRDLSDDKKREVVNKMRFKNENFYLYFIDDETKILIDLLRECHFELDMGINNDLYPKYLTNNHINQKLNHLQNVVICMTKIKLELNYILETIPGDNNKYSDLSKSIKEYIDDIISYSEAVFNNELLVTWR